jgi:STE24 endopeptidase
MLKRWLLAICVVFPLLLAGCSRETTAERAANEYAAQEIAAAPVHGNLPDYSLPPDKLAKAEHLASVHVTMHFADEIWGFVQIALLLWLGVIAWMQFRGERLGQIRGLQIVFAPYVFLVFTLLLALVPTLLLFVSGLLRRAPFVELLLLLLCAGLVWTRRAIIRKWSFRWVEGYGFLLVFLLVSTLLELPLDMYSHHLSRKYGLSVQGWASWFGDQGKAFLLSWIVGGLLLMLLFWVIRKLPRSWWLLFWVFTIPISIFGLFVMPYIEPIFDHYEPLAKTNPALVAKLEQVVQKGHMDIPPDRMFLMKASEKTTTLNADVEGFGHSKRVVVWDTSIAKASPDEILFIFGHESGHYVLGHIARGLILSFVGSFILLWLGFHFVRWAIARFGPRWRIPSQEDWGALAVLLLAFSLFSIFLEPVTSLIGRGQEHAADVYGQEAIHGIVPDPQAAAKGAFDVLGETGLSDPNPSRFIEFWTYGHPAVGRRAAFAKAYDPWAEGMEPKYFKK